MVEILKYNDDNLQDNEIDEVVTRVKAFIVSSKNNMYLISSVTYHSQCSIIYL